MRIESRGLALLAVLVLPVGCAKQVEPTPTVEILPFTIEKSDPALTPSCSTGDLEGCDANQALQAAMDAMKALHGRQMDEMGSSLSTLSELLNREDTPPTARITARPLSTDGWSDPQATYPAEMELRVQTERGLSRMGEGTEEALKAAIAATKELSKAHAEEWQTTLKDQPKGLALPKGLLAQRTPAEVVVKLDDGNHKLKVPAHLGAIHIRRTVAPWVAVASHVTTSPGNQYDPVHEHRVAFDGALAVSGKGPFLIEEQKPSRSKHSLTSEITPGDACQNLRGEVRFIRADEALRMRAVFRDVAAAGGAK